MNEERAWRTFTNSGPWLWQWARYSEEECDKRGLVKGDRESVVAVLGEGWEEAAERPPVVEVGSSALWARLAANVDDLRRRAVGRKPDSDDVTGLAVVNVPDNEEQGEVERHGPFGIDEVDPVGGAEDVEQAGGVSVRLFRAVAEQGGNKPGRFGHVRRFLRGLIRRGDSSGSREARR